MHKPLYCNKDNGADSSCHLQQPGPAWGRTSRDSQAQPDPLPVLTPAACTALGGANFIAMTPNAPVVGLRYASIHQAASPEPLSNLADGKHWIAAIQTWVQILALLLCT